MDVLEKRYGFSAPRDKGLNTVGACQGVLDGRVKGFMGLGGNLVRAVPETDLIEAAWTRLPVTVQIATKLNRSHLVHGKVAYLLPCLGRIEIDRQAAGPQSVTMEDSTGCMHGSRGVTEPASAALLSEPAIVAGIADARPLPAAQRQWKTPNGRANFKTPRSLDEDPDMHTTDPDVLRLMTMRSDDQFNTTVYSLDDRFRGVFGTRRVLLMNITDIGRLGFQEGDRVTATTVARDQDRVSRSVAELRVTSYDIPEGCVAGYFPECNPLIPLWHHAEGSFVPAAKAIPVRLQASVPRPVDAGRGG